MRCFGWKGRLGCRGWWVVDELGNSGGWMASNAEMKTITLRRTFFDRDVCACDCGVLREDGDAVS